MLPEVHKQASSPVPRQSGANARKHTNRPPSVLANTSKPKRSETRSPSMPGMVHWGRPGGAICNSRQLSKIHTNRYENRKNQPPPAASGRRLACLGPAHDASNEPNTLPQTVESGAVEDFKPAASNQGNKQFPKVNSERRVRAQISAPGAKEVRLDLAASNTS